eukprot:scaffold189225_cov22-Tisochrysis_lutea.AAC.2
MQLSCALRDKEPAQTSLVHPSFKCTGTCVASSPAEIGGGLPSPAHPGLRSPRQAAAPKRTAWRMRIASTLLC